MIPAPDPTFDLESGIAKYLGIPVEAVPLAMAICQAPDPRGLVREALRKAAACKTSA